jgi:putative nucleotidyltransferase with HDIG domain
MIDEMDAAQTASGRELGLPRVVAATFLVAVFPSLLVYGLVAEGVFSSPVLSILIATLLSLAVCQIAGMYWQRRRSSDDVLFGDLMIWGWARRRLIERRLATAVALFGPAATATRQAPVALSVQRRMRLLHRLASDLEASDPYTHGHSRRVARYASLIASQMGLEPAEVAEVRAAAALHDVGKINTPTELLHKPGRLTDEEFAIVKRHPEDGAQMISVEVNDEELVSIVRHHHERLDGTGYPSGLTGSQIPLGARIIAVADTFDAITSQRPYRPAKPHKAALDILRAEAGTQLDPDAVHAFCGLYFARRPIGALVALINLAERALSGSIGGALDTARIAGIAAVTAGVGGAALVPSGVANRFTPSLARYSAHAPRRTPASDRKGDAYARSPNSSRCCRPSGAGGSSSQQASGRLAQAGNARRPTSHSDPPSSTGPANFPDTGRRATGAGVSDHPTAPTNGPVIATVVAPAGSGAPSVSTTIKPGGPGSPAASATVTPGASGAPNVSATVTPGASGAPNVSATVTPGTS